MDQSRIYAIRKPVFLLGPHKSGTSLLRSLLDSHPDLAVLPRESHFFWLAGFWIDYGLKRAHPEFLDEPSLTRRLVAFVESQNGDRGPYSDSPDFKGYDLDRFTSFLSQSVSGDHRSLFDYYLGALYYSYTGQPPDPGLRIVEKSVEHSELVCVLRRFYPDARFIHIVRNPYANLVAIRNSRSGKGYPKLRRACASLYNSYYNLFRNEYVADTYLVIRYEDLVQKTQEVMRGVCQYLELAYDETLLHPTQDNVPWNGNTTSNMKFEGISRLPLRAWEHQINHLEVELINRILPHILERFGYEKLGAGRSGYLPVRGESLVRYIANRSLFSMWKK